MVFKRNSGALVSAVLIFLLIRYDYINFTGSIIFSINALFLCYGNALYKYVTFRNYGFAPYFKIHKIFYFVEVLDVAIINKTVRKMDYLIISLVVPFICLSFTLNLHQLFAKSNSPLTVKHPFLTPVIYLTYVTAISFKDIISFKQIIKGLFSFRFVYVRINEFWITEFIEEKNCLFHHRNIYLIEQDYKDYRLIDLQREKIYLEGKLEKAKLLGFYEKFIYPLMMFSLGAIVPLFSALLQHTITGDTDQIISIEKLIGLFLLFLFSLIFPIAILSMVLKMPSYSNVENLKSRILVLENISKTRS